MLTYRKERGLLLHPVTRERGQWHQAAWLRLVYTEAAMLALWGLTGYAFGGALCAMTGVLCLAWAALDRFHMGRSFPLAALGLLAVLTLALRPWVVEGFRLFWGDLSDCLVERTGYLLPRWRSSLGSNSETISCLSFSLALSLALVPGLGLLAWAAPGGAGLLLLTADILGAVALGGGTLPGLCCPALVVAALLPLLGRRGQMAPRLWAQGLCGLTALALALACMGGTWQEESREAFRQTLHKTLYDTAATTLPEGRLADHTLGRATAAPALTVTMDRPQTLYLRGFTGERYENGTWTALEPEILAENRELLAWLGENAFTPGTQFASAAAGEGLETALVTVRNTGACGKWMYVPYQLCPGDWLDGRDLSQGSLAARSGREYQYTVLLVEQEDLSRIIQEMGDQVTTYRKAESGYREFVLAQYLEIPEEMTEALGSAWQQTQDSLGVSDQTCAVEFLRQCFPAEGESEISLPLENAAGTSYQYATVAAMTLRRFGIPARYVEGYVISQEKAESANGGAIQVDSSCARAWVEVYQEGIGWLPMELTPGLGETTETVEQTQQQPQEEEEEPTQPQEEEEADSQDGTVTGREKASFLWLLVPGVLLLLALAVVARHGAVMKKREKRFRTLCVADAVGWIVADGIRMLEKTGISRNKGSLRSMCPALEAWFGREYVELFQKAAEDNDRALFSSRAMEEPDRTAALSFRAATIAAIRGREKPLRRWWGKWILCLY